MPKLKSSQASLYRQWISKFNNGEKVHSIDGKVIYCQACQKQVECSRLFQLEQHNKGEKHAANVVRFLQQAAKQQFLKVDAPDPFAADLCFALVSANIPLYKVNHPIFKAFLEKNCKRNVPDESTLRKNYLKAIFNQVIDSIKAKVDGKYVWASVDETTDSQGRHATNLLIGTMNEEDQKPHLVATKFLEKVNNSTIARFVNDSLREFISSDQLLLLVTDGVAYMLKAGEALSVFYPNMIHVTCVCHGLNRVCEFVRIQFPNVDQLINQTKKVFRKAPSRIVKFKKLCPGMPLPPKPVLTRWGTWLEAANYYCTNFNVVKEVVGGLDSEDASSIHLSKKAFEDNSISQCLACVQAHFSILPVAIKKLEEQNMTLNRALAVLYEVVESLENVPGEMGAVVNDKMKSVLEKNRGLAKLMKIDRMLNGEILDEVNLAPDVIAAYKFAPIQSCDVERSFSVYKTILADNRNRFTPEALEMYIICNCYEF